MISIVEKIFRYAEANSDKPALTDGKTALSYGELAERILSSGKILHERFNISRGDNVILSADKQLEFVSLYFACHILEAVTLPIAPDTNAKRYALIKSKVRPKLIVGFNDDSEDIMTAGLDEFSGINAESVNLNNINFPSEDSVADIIFTTGTTGEPKGVKLTHRNISAAAKNINTFIANSHEDIEMLALPVSHSFGLGRMRCALSNGQTLVMLGSFANVKRFFRFIETFHVNGFGMVPASWALLKKLSGETLGKYHEQIHYIEIGSAPMPIDEKKFLIELLPDTRICMHYGLTEASRSAFMEFHEEISRLDTIGRQSPNMQIAIFDEQGQKVPDNIEGEICVKGDAVTSGYIGMDNKAFFWGDYFRTGDWGFRNSDGYITLKSRKKELINVGGKKVSPVEVEEVLRGFDFVKDCACIAIRDVNGILGEVVKAFIVSDNPEKVNFEYLDGLIGDKLEGFKHPAEYEVIDAIPKTSSGKVQRLLLVSN